jgi:hypothetical protein
MELRISIATGACLLALAQAAPAAATTTEVGGDWASAVPCVPFEGSPSLENPTQIPYTCEGSATVRGSLVGVTVYTTYGTIDLASGDSWGTMKERFTGVSADGSLRGTMDFKEKFTIDGATLFFDDTAKIVGGSGDFAGSRGAVIFNGTVAAGVGGGSWGGTWVH